MKLIHLSDLHLGKRLNEFSLLEDQAYILMKILNVIDAEQPDALGAVAPRLQVRPELMPSAQFHTSLPSMFLPDDSKELLFLEFKLSEDVSFESTRSEEPRAEVFPVEDSLVVVVSAVFHVTPPSVVTRFTVEPESETPVVPSDDVVLSVEEEERPSDIELANVSAIVRVPEACE